MNEAEKGRRAKRIVHSMRSALRASTEAFQHLADAAQRATVALSAAADRIAQEARELHRAEWWKRQELPPEYVAEYEPPEWWQSGDEPPDLFSAE